MNMNRLGRSLIVVVAVAVLTGCSGNTGSEADEDAARAAQVQEESGTEFALSDTYDEVRNGARLILTYDAPSNSFAGSVQNTTEDTLDQVRVEVHLSNGVELGPTTPTADRAGSDVREPVESALEGARI